MNRNLLTETAELSLNGKIKFPEFVGVMVRENIESYSIDLVRHLRTFRMANGETHSDSFEFKACPAAAEFSCERVVKAIRARHAGEITYREFLACILEAGSIRYTVSIREKHATYYGRTGAHHTEKFPGAK